MKIKGLIVNIIVYLIAFGCALVPFIFIENIFLSTWVFTTLATLIVFIGSCIYSDVSIYDPYWSVAPPVMILINMVKYNLWNINAIILFIVVMLWSIRLTTNWYYTYKGVGFEDWRYAMYRSKYSKLIFTFISFTGLHFIPTIVVYLGLVSGIFAMQIETFSPFSIIGIVIMVSAVILEYVSDKAIHKFLNEHKGEHKTCSISVWKYSRHPNYLGEMSFWTGMFMYFLPLKLDTWYYGLGFLSIIILFLVVSIPLMEKHNLERRVDYKEYKEKTSMLLILPNKK